MANTEHPGDQPEAEAGPSAQGTADEAEEHRQSERGAESYGGDPDTEPSVTEDEVEAGLKRDQAEG